MKESLLGFSTWQTDGLLEEYAAWSQNEAAQIAPGVRDVTGQEPHNFETFDGEHSFVLEPINQNRVRFTQSEKFSGLLLPIFVRSMDADTQRGFDKMNKALKARAEQPTA